MRASTGDPLVPAGTLMQFDRLEPGELITLLLAAIAGGSLYAIVVTSLAPKLAMAPNTRVALAMVARGEAPLGIVYTTDANGGEILWRSPAALR